MVQAYSSNSVQRLSQEVVDGTNPGRLALSIDVVEEWAQLLPLLQLPGDILQCFVDADREQQWHQRIALLAAFCLDDCAVVALVVVPRIRGGLRIG